MCEALGSIPSINKSITFVCVCVCTLIANTSIKDEARLCCCGSILCSSVRILDGLFGGRKCADNDGWMGKWMDGWMDGRIDGWLTAKVDICTERRCSRVLSSKVT